MLSAVFAVACGGAIGALSRYLLTLLIPAGAFPFTTLLVNVAGSFAIGIVSVFLVPSSAQDSLRLFIQVGVLGGFTTFSTYSLDALQLLHSGRLVMAFVYMVATVALCLASVFAGMQLARLMQQSA